MCVCVRVRSETEKYLHHIFVEEQSICLSLRPFRVQKAKKRRKKRRVDRVRKSESFRIVLLLVLLLPPPLLLPLGSNVILFYRLLFHSHLFWLELIIPVVLQSVLSVFSFSFIHGAVDVVVVAVVVVVVTAAIHLLRSLYKMRTMVAAKPVANRIKMKQNAKKMEPIRLRSTIIMGRRTDRHSQTHTHTTSNRV